MDSKRIRFTAEDLLNRYLEVQKPPEILVKEMREPPLSNLISHYYMKPVNFEKDPFASTGGFTKGNPKSYKKPTNEGASGAAGTGAFNREGMKRAQAA
jgi:hypothetical protein